MTSQNSAILAYLKAGGRLTDENARQISGTNRCSARIFDLRKKGYPIQDIWREGTNRYGHKIRYKEYFMREDTL